MFGGVGVALVTPFDENLNIDYTTLNNVLSHIKKGKINYLTVNGTTGEASTINNTEKAALLNHIVKNHGDDFNIMYGIGANNTQYVLDLIDQTDFSGVQAILTVAPYYNKPTQEGIYQHYVAIADKSPVPVFMYNVPARTGLNIEVSTTLRLAQHPNIAGIKEASGDLMQCYDIVAAKPDDFMLISGDDGLTVPMMSIGAEGVISVIANAYPIEFGEVIDLAMNNNFKQAAEQMFPLLEMNKLLYVEGSPVGVKAALAMRGMGHGRVRLPLVEASIELKEALKSASLHLVGVTS